MAQFVQEGEAVDYTPGADVAAGSIVVLNDLIGITKRDIKANTLGALAVVGVFDVDKVLANTFAIGAKVYWDAAAGKATSNATGTVLLGKAVLAALTLRELMWMVDARRQEAWQHTSVLLATIANIHRDPKKKPRPYRPSDFQPSHKPQVQAVQSSVQILKQVFVDRK